MLHRSYHPGPPLSEFVEDFWLYDDYWPRHFKERFKPGGAFGSSHRREEDQR
jgi:hypothetical protein